MKAFKKFFARKVLFALVLGLTTLIGSAYGSAGPNTVYNVITGGTIVYFHITGAVYASCATNQRYVLDTTSAFGKNTYAMVLSAYLAGKPLGVLSTGTCTLMPNDAEDVGNVYTN